MGVQHCHYSIFALFPNEATWRFMTEAHWAPEFDIKGAVTSFFEGNSDQLPAMVICFPTEQGRKLNPPSKPSWTVQPLL